MADVPRRAQLDDVVWDLARRQRFDSLMGAQGADPGDAEYIPAVNDTYTLSAGDATEMCSFTAAEAGRYSFAAYVTFAAFSLGNFNLSAQLQGTAGPPYPTLQSSAAAWQGKARSDDPSYYSGSPLLQNQVSLGAVADMAAGETVSLLVSRASPEVATAASVEAFGTNYSGMVVTRLS